MSERSVRLTANNQQRTKPGCEDTSNDGSRRTVGHDANSGGDRDDDQPNYYHADFIHGPKDSTTQALPHVVTRTMGQRVGASLSHWNRTRKVIRTLSGPGRFCFGSW